MVDDSRLYATVAAYVEAVAGGTVDVGRQLEALADRTVGVVRCHGAGPALTDDDDDRLVWVAATDGVLAAVEPGVLDPPGSPCGAAYTAEAPVVTGNLTENRWADYARAATHRQLHAVAALPMVALDEPIGVLALAWFEPHQATREELAAAARLAAIGQQPHSLRAHPTPDPVPVGGLTPQISQGRDGPLAERKGRPDGRPQ